MRRVALPPIVDSNTRVIILGTMPGDESLRLQQYYANPSNQFWKIIYSLFDKSPEGLYTERTAFLQSHRIGLWDVYRECIRQGSSDAKIQHGQLNDIPKLLEKFTQIRCIAFNGGSAEKAFDRGRKGVRFTSCDSEGVRGSGSLPATETTFFENSKPLLVSTRSAHKLIRNVH